MILIGMCCVCTYNTVAARALLEWDRAGVIRGGFDVVGCYT